MGLRCATFLLSPPRAAKHNPTLWPRWWRTLRLRNLIPPATARATNLQVPFGHAAGGPTSPPTTQWLQRLAQIVVRSRHVQTARRGRAQGRGQRGHRQPRAQRQARRLRGDPPGGAHRPRRARLRAADQAARRAGPAGRAGAARAAEPDLPGVRRGRRRRARPAGLHAGAVHPDGRRHLGGRLRRPAPPAAGVRASSSPAASTPSGRAATTTTRGCAARNLPTVLVNASIEGLGFPRVSCDDAVAVEQAMGHLLSLGHTRIGLLLGPSDHVPSKRKLAAARAIAARVGHRAAEPTTSSTALYSLEAGQAAATRLLKAGVTGIVCASDPLALGAIRAVRRAGLRCRGRLGRRLRRLGPHELHRAAADHGAPADRADGPAGHRAAGRPDRREPVPPTSCSSSPSSSSAARPGPRPRSLTPVRR